MKNLHLDLIRVTEAAAIAASKWIGSGTEGKELADKAATDAMRNRLQRLDVNFHVAVGEGEKDNSHGLFNGEIIGPNGDANYDLAVDPIEGTNPTVNAGPDACSVIGVANRGCLFDTKEFYMHKLVYGPAIYEKVKLSILDSIETIVDKVSYATAKSRNEIMACVLDRPRHLFIIKELRRLGVRIKLIKDCDVGVAIATCFPASGIDFYVGTGGTPEAIITACAIKCLKGDMQTQLSDRDGILSGPKVFQLNDLVDGECQFIATGITDGSLLKGVRWTINGSVTHSLSMRSESGTVRFVETYHGN